MKGSIYFSQNFVFIHQKVNIFKMKMSKEQGYMQPDKKPYLDYVKNDILKVKNMDDLKDLGKTMKDAKALEKREVEELFNSKFLQAKNVPQLAALCIVVPTNAVPNQLYSLISKLLPDMKNLNFRIQNGIAYKYVEAAISISEGKNLLANDIFIALFYDSPAIYAGPYLRLLASIKDPKDIFEKNAISYTKEPRIDVLTLYYYSINLLLLNNYKKSEQFLLRSYKLAKKAKIDDTIPSIVEKLSLASFLNHVPHTVFLSLVKLTHHPEKHASSIWDLDNSNYLDQIQDPKNFYNQFRKQIIFEHTRRVIIDFTISTSEMPLQLLIEACNNPDTMEVLALMKSSGEIKFRIKDNIIKFIKFNYQVQIDQEQENIKILLPNE